jgi:hypothetical protein
MPLLPLAIEPNELPRDEVLALDFYEPAAQLLLRRLRPPTAGNVLSPGGSAVRPRASVPRSRRRRRSS